MLLTAAVAVALVGAPSDAQTVPPVQVELPGTDDQPDISNDGNIVVFRSVDADGAASIQVHNRIADTTAPLLATFPAGVTHPTISANGCLVAFGVFDTSTPPVTAPPATDPPATDPPATDPPATDPPATDAPTTEPPGTDPVPGGDEPAESPSQSGSEDEITPTPTLAQSDPDAGDQPVASAAAAQQVSGAASVQVVDRCADPAATVAQLTLSGLDAAPQPALSADGAVLVLSDGNDILRLARTSAGSYGSPVRFDGVDAPSDDVATRPEVTISADGSVVAFASGPADASGLGQSTLYVWNDGDVAVVQPGAWAPSISADGRLMTYEDELGVWVVDRATLGAAPIQLAPGAAMPRISADGNHVLHSVNGELRVISWTENGDMPFGVSTSSTVSGAPNPAASAGAIDAVGSVVVSDDAAPSAGTDADIVLSPQSISGSFSSTMYDLGAGDIGAVLDATLTFTNDGQASIEVAELLVDAPFQIASTDCVGSIRPGATCTIEVTFTVERLEDAFGEVSLSPAGVGASVITTEVTALGEAPPVTTTPTTSPTTTVVTGGTTGTTGTTTSGTTGGTTTSTSGTTGGTTTTTTGGSTTSRNTTTTTTTLVPGAGVTFSPATFDFAPTIVDAGRRVATIEIVNASTTAVSIVGVRLEPQNAPFEIVETACAGETLAGNSRCSVDVAFAPTDQGEASVRVIAQLDGGVEIEATLNGEGAPPPTLRFVPGVATVGQVITLRGAGFPTGLTVSVTLENGLFDGEVVVTDAGTFDVPVVVLPNTPQGPIAANVAAQDDQFAEVATTMVITSTSDRSSPSVLDGVGPNIGR